MLLPLSECARLTGLSRSALLKAISRGRVSAAKDEKNGQWVIDSAELSRVYPIESEPVSPLPPNDTLSAVHEEQLRSADGLIAALKDERDYLRRRLDEESATIGRLTTLLETTRPPAVPVAAPSADSHRVPLILYVIGTVAGLMALGALAWFLYIRATS